MFGDIGTGILIGSVAWSAYNLGRRGNKANLYSFNLYRFSSHTDMFTLSACPCEYLQVA